MNTNVEVSKEVVAVPDMEINAFASATALDAEEVFVQTDAEVGGEVIAEPVASVTVH